MRKTNRPARGFTLLETMIVIGIMMILSGLAVVQSFGMKEIYQANSAMDIVAGQLRVARQLAISQRRLVQVTFSVNTTPQTISYQVQASTGVNAGAAGPIMTMPLPNGTQFVMEAGVPDTPMGFGTCSGSSPVCIGGASCCPATMYFTSTGQFAGNSFGTNVYNGTVFVGVPNQVLTARAVTIMGSTGRVRPYTYVGPVGGTSQVVWTE